MFRTLRALNWVTTHKKSGYPTGKCLKDGRYDYGN
jgi:hypothetical protein